jgi:hypothetical protein
LLSISSASLEVQAILKTRKKRVRSGDIVFIHSKSQLYNSKRMK